MQDMKEAKMRLAESLRKLEEAFIGADEERT